MQWLLRKCSGFLATLSVKHIHALKKNFKRNNLLSSGVFCLSHTTSHTPSLWAGKFECKLILIAKNKRPPHRLNPCFGAAPFS